MADVTIRAIAITISDSRNETDDISGQNLVECLQDFGAEIVDKILITDDLESLIEALRTSAERANLIITSGGTGLAIRDNTPEATRVVIEKEASGLAEMLRAETAKINPKAWLSRGVCGIRGNCLIINFPGSPKAVQEYFAVLKPLLQHAINLIEGETKH